MTIGRVYIYLCAAANIRSMKWGLGMKKLIALIIILLVIVGALYLYINYI